MRRQIDSITGVRAISAMIIAYVTHYMILIGAPFKGWAGWLFFQVSCVYTTAPDLFFVLSGFLICMIYEEKFISRAITFVDFIVPKIIKIYPLMIVMAVVIYVLENKGLSLFGEYPLYSYKGEERYTMFNLILNILGLQCGWISETDDRAINGPSWFISILMVCYSLHYLVANYSKGPTRIPIYVLLVIVGSVIYIHPLNVPLMYTNNGRGYYGYFIGVLMAEIFERKKIDTIYLEKFAIPIGIISTIVWSLSIYWAWDGPVDVTKWMILVFYPMFTYTIIYGRFFKWIWSRKIFVKLGKIAMEIFLCNVPTLVAIYYIKFYLSIDISLTNVPAWIVVILISLIVAGICYWLFEEIVGKYMLRMFKRLRYNDSNK